MPQPDPTTPSNPSTPVELRPAPPTAARWPRRTGRRVPSAVALVLAGGLVGGSVGAGLTAALGDDAPATTSAATGSAGAAVGSTAGRVVVPAGSAAATSGVEAAIATIDPSTVTIEVEAASSGAGGGGTATGTGSGAVFRADGYILTNNHVVAEAARSGRIRVRFADDTTADATVVGRDPSSDLAVVKVERSGLAPAAFADSGALRVGQTVLAVGSPLGLDGTITSGIVSAVDRPVRLGGNDATSQGAVIDAVQTDAAINPGNSGGPLVDTSGRIVGINTAIAAVSGGPQSSASGNIGVGFAIPADDAVAVAEQLIADGAAEHAVLGVSAADADDRGGAVLQSLPEGSAAAAAGLREGDTVTAVADRPVVDTDSLVAAVRDHRPGESVALTYRRGGQPATATVRLGSRSSNSS